MIWSDLLMSIPAWCLICGEGHLSYIFLIARLMLIVWNPKKKISDDQKDGDLMCGDLGM